jgi:hypothetical protein
MKPLPLLFFEFPSFEYFLNGDIFPASERRRGYSLNATYLDCLNASLKPVTQKLNESNPRKIRSGLLKN